MGEAGAQDGGAGLALAVPSDSVALEIAGAADEAPSPVAFA